MASTWELCRVLFCGAGRGGPSGVTYALVIPPSTTKSYKIVRHTPSLTSPILNGIASFFMQTKFTYLTINEA
jgi:hypothetical protein